MTSTSSDFLSEEGVHGSDASPVHNSARRNSGGRRMSGGGGRRNSKGRRASGEPQVVEETPQTQAMARELEHVQQQQRRMSLERGRRPDIVTSGYNESASTSANNSPNRSPRGKEVAHPEHYEWGTGGLEARSSVAERRSSGAYAGEGPNPPSTRVDGSIGSLSMVDTARATIGTVVDDMVPGFRRVSQSYRLPLAVGTGPASAKAATGSPTHAWTMNGAASPLASGLHSPASPTEGSPRQKRPNGIFSHKGVWVRPAAIGEVLSQVNEEERFPPLEDHAGFIDARAGLDVAHAILAFEFIDRINDEVLHHYLPLIDNELGKQLGLRHERGRLRTPVENAHPGDTSARSSPVVDGSETEGGEGSQSTAYYDHVEQVSGSNYEAASNGESAGGDPVGEDDDSRRSRPDSRQESWGSASHAEDLTPEGSYKSGDAWDEDAQGQDSRSRDSRSRDSRSRDSRSEPPLEDSRSRDSRSDAFDDEISEDRDYERQTSSGADAYEDERSVSRSRSSGRSFGESEDSPERQVSGTSRATGTSGAPESDALEPLRSNSDQSEESVMPEPLGKAPSGILQSGGPSSGSHGFGSRAGGFWGGSNSAESQVWPHACSILPKAASGARSSKLKAVDSIPDPISQNMFDISTSSAGEGANLPRQSTLSVGKVSHPNAMGGGAFDAKVRRSTILSGMPLDVILPDVNAPPKPSALNSLPLSYLSLPRDPGVAAAGASAVYGPGACRVRRPGDKSVVDRANAKMQRRAQRRTRESARAAQRSSKTVATGIAGNSGSPVTSAGKTDSNLVDGSTSILAGSAPTGNVSSGGLNTTPPSSSRDAAGAAGHRGTTAAVSGDARGDGGGGGILTAGVSSPVGSSGQTTTSSSRHMAGMGHTNGPGCLPVAEEEQPWPPRRPSPTGDQFEDLLSMHLRGDNNQPVSQSSPSDRRQRRANSTCPFSHDHMDSSSAVDLRCGHRFALARLGVARRAARLCCSAGFAIEDALICPLCGDQDITSKPGASKMLKTYSTNTDAYLGDLRKDWRRPLHLPMQTAASAEPPCIVEAGQLPGDGQNLESGTPIQAGPLASTPTTATSSAPMSVKKPSASAPASARPSGRIRASTLGSMRKTIDTTPY